MQEKLKKNAKIIITVAIVIAFVWFLIIYPMITFHQNEQKLEAAARRYFELNQNELPTGERVKTVTLNTLYHKSFLKKDIYIPYSRKTCSIDNSWVKVRRENNEYKYYVYLECGKLSSIIDHKGPTINLNGDKNVTINKGEEYTDPGVKSLVDNKDGRLDKKEVSVKGDVDENKVGTYEITYTAFDNLKNKTVEKRIIKVVERISNTIEERLNGKSNFIGNPGNNFVRLSNMLFRVYGVDNDKNVILVSDEDIANVNFTKIDKWLDYFYEHLTADAKKLIVESKYCNMKVDESSLNATECTSYTEKLKVYVPSIIEINSAQAENKNFMRPPTMSWTADAKDDNTAFLTRSYFFEENEGKVYVPYDQKHYYGIRPMLKIKGSTLIVSGDGTRNSPFEFKKANIPKGGSPVNERETGEYVSINGAVYRIVEVEKDGTTRVIANENVASEDDDVQCSASSDKDKVTYNPKNKNSIGYYINNKAIKFVETSFFEKHEIEVPIYKKDIIYGEEIKKEKYEVVLSAPDMFEMFAAQPQNSGEITSYWTANISQKDRTVGAIYNIGVPLNQEIPKNMSLKIRVVGFLKKDTVITDGNGTIQKPYKIK